MALMVGGGLLGLQGSASISSGGGRPSAGWKLSDLTCVQVEPHLLMALL